jgi:hypothetical protein
MQGHPPDTTRTHFASFLSGLPSYFFVVLEISIVRCIRGTYICMDKSKHIHQNTCSGMIQFKNGKMKLVARVGSDSWVFLRWTIPLYITVGIGPV